MRIEMMVLLDLAGAMLSVWVVLLFAEANRLAWPVSILSNIVNGLLYWRTGIYGHACLEVGYVALNFYGWYYWQKASQQLVTRASHRELGALLLAVCVLSPVLYQSLVQFNSTVPLLDSVTTILNISAYWLMCRARLQSWALWFFVDSIYLIIYWQKALPFHILLVLIYLVLAVRGYKKWRQMLAVAPIPKEFA